MSSLWKYLNIISKFRHFVNKQQNYLTSSFENDTKSMNACSMELKSSHDSANVK